MVTVIKANKREIPGDLPPALWWDRLREIECQGVDIPWYLPQMEYLRPEDLQRVRAKALIWYEVTGQWPQDINFWWEVRQARNRGDLALRAGYAVSAVDGEGILRCGECAARCSPDSDGTYGQRCNLCGTPWIVRCGDAEAAE